MTIKRKTSDSHLSSVALLTAVLHPEKLSDGERQHIDRCSFCKEVIDEETKTNPIFRLARSGVTDEFWEEVQEAIGEIQVERQEENRMEEETEAALSDPSEIPTPIPLPMPSGILAQLVGPFYEASARSSFPLHQWVNRVLFTLVCMPSRTIHPFSPRAVGALRTRRALVASYSGCFAEVARSSLESLMEVETTSDSDRLRRAMSGEEPYDVLVLDTACDFVFELDVPTPVRRPFLLAGEKHRIETFLRYVVKDGQLSYSTIDPADSRLEVALRVSGLLEPSLLVR
jgi:hypothetical protein